MRLLILLLLCLSLPMAVLLERNGYVLAVQEVTLGVLGVALLIYSVSALLKKLSPRLAGIITTALLLLALLIRFLLGFLYDFAGRGFTSEFWAHLNPTAFQVALNEYGKEGTILLLLLIVVGFFTYRFTVKGKSQALSVIFASFTVGCLTTYYAFEGTPEGLLAKAYSHYNHSTTLQAKVSKLQARKSVTQLLAPLDVQIPLEKSQLTASAAEQPSDLILVYLESFNQVFTDEKLFPGLTPQIAKLKQQYNSLDKVYSSAYVTIEGIANSQCGTLVNMEYANDSMTTSKGRLPLLPCLGDVLNKAGYTQSYLGGASLEFTSKGLFLKEHGYQQTLGKPHWESLNYESIGIWGFSDTDLYSNALETIRAKRQQNKPYNVTLLTLGTHRPGFVYEGCPIYTKLEDKNFLNAVHCADHLLGKFVEQLENDKILDETVLFIQGDHGVFPTPDMLRLIGDEAYLPKVFTLVATPNLTHQSILRSANDTISSTVSGVDTLLDLLAIEHNAKFALSRSLLKKQPHSPYVLSRRSDYYQNQSITNTQHSCQQNILPQAITLPLDECEKKAVMRSLEDLNSSYTFTDPVDNRVCELAANIVQNPDNKHFQINWGNHILTNQFYYRGFKKNKHMLKGIYLIVLDSENTVLQTQFYAADNKPEMKLLNQLLDDASSGTQIILLSDVQLADLPGDMAKLWPTLLREQKLVYGSIQNRQFVVHHQQSKLKNTNAFKPINCDIAQQISDN